MRPAQQLAKVILLLILTTNKDANARVRNPFSRPAARGETPAKSNGVADRYSLADISL